MSTRVSTPIALLSVIVLAGTVLRSAAASGLETTSRARIAFIESNPGGSRAAIYTVQPDGTGKRRITPPRRPQDRIDDLAWSPDGRKLVYVWNDFGYRKKPSYADLFVIAATGGKPRRLVSAYADEMNPAWSPDGRKIAYDHSDDGWWAVHVVNADGTHKRRLTPGIHFHGPAWSADGRKLACTDRYPRHYTMDSDGRHRRRLTRLPGGGDQVRFDVIVAWSPRAPRRLAFLNDYDVWLAEGPQLRTQRKLFDGEGRATRDLRWSPDGRQIAFAHRDETRKADYDIFVVDINGANVRQLTENESHDEDPTWSPDGQALAFSRDGEIYVINADGANEQNISRSAQPNREPRWAPRG
jgi:Tol biopolymer transport system component